MNFYVYEESERTPVFILSVVCASNDNRNDMYVCNSYDELYDAFEQYDPKSLCATIDLSQVSNFNRRLIYDRLQQMI